MSMQRVTNYGSFLQAYGLMHTIQGICPEAEVEFVDYEVGESLVQSTESADVKHRSVFQRAVKMLSPQYRRYRKQQLRLNQSFQTFFEVFQTQFLPQLHISERKNILPTLDILVIGSDEVFNCTQAGDVVGYSTQLFGKNHQAEKLISYAASFGSTTLEKLERYNKTDELGELLSRFDGLSVRDSNSCRIVEQLCGRKPEKNIDPVLLYGFPEVENKSVNIKDYLVVYAYADRITETEAETIQKFAREQGKKILTLGFWQTFADDYVLATPLEVLAYIKHADFVITDTFHGTVFSIKYQVPFATIIRESNKEKLGDLLDTFGLRSREVKKINKLSDVLLAPLQRETIEMILSNEQQRAQSYLEKYLT